MRRILSLFLVFASALAGAGPTSPAVRAEIEALLTGLQASGCQFHRNGSWYGSAEAKSHLLRKLEYLEDKRPLESTEQFIALAASRSSVSGEPYWVKCGDGAPAESQQWLTRQLLAIRAATENEAKR